MAMPTSFIRFLLVKGLPALLLAALLAPGCSGNRTDQEATALDYFKRGNTAFEKEDYRHAIRMYQQAASLDPRSPVIQYNLGLAYYQAHTYPDSVTAYSRALQLDPTMAEAHRNLALAEDRLYNLESAQTHYNIYQAMMRARDQKPADGSASSGTPGAASVTSNTASAPQPKPASATPATSARPGNRTGLPEPVSQLRRFDKDGKVVGSDAGPTAQANPTGGDTKWWTQDSSSRAR